jgi:hypothetical protein
VAIVPVAAEMLGDFGDNPAGVISYAISMSGVGLTFEAQMLYAYRRGLIRPEVREMERRHASPATSSSQPCSCSRSRSRCSAPWRRP